VDQLAILGEFCVIQRRSSPVLCKRDKQLLQLLNEPPMERYTRTEIFTIAARSMGYTLANNQGNKELPISEIYAIYRTTTWRTHRAFAGSQTRSRRLTPCLPSSLVLCSLLLLSA
jgi:hypothetical protein